MACQINESAQDVLAFKNAGALMSVTVNNIPKDYIWAKLTSMTAQGKTTAPAIAGNAQIAFAEGIPTLTTTGTLNSSSITINFTAGNDVTSKTFYFPLPVAEYPALELSIGNGATSQVLKTKALDAKRNERYTTTITLDEVSGSVPTTVGSVSAVVNALATTNSVSVTDVAPTEASPTVSIPKKNTPAENVSKMCIRDRWYFIVWFMAATGARVSELLHIKAEHIQIGHLDLYSNCLLYTSPVLCAITTPSLSRSGAAILSTPVLHSFNVFLMKLCFSSSMECQHSHPIRRCHADRSLSTDRRNRIRIIKRNIRPVYPYGA